MNPEINELHSDGNGRNSRCPRLCEFWKRMVKLGLRVGPTECVYFLAWECREPPSLRALAAF